MCLEDTIHGLLKEMKEIREENSLLRVDNRALKERLERCEQDMDCMKDSHATLQNYVLKIALEVGWKPSSKSRSVADDDSGPSMDEEFVNQNRHCSPETGRSNKSWGSGVGLFGSQSNDLGFLARRSAADTFATQAPFYARFPALRPYDAVKRSSVQLHELPQSSLMADHVNTEEAVSSQPAQPHARPPAPSISALINAPLLTSSISDAKVATRICKLLFSYIEELPQGVAQRQVISEVKDDGTIEVWGSSSKLGKGQRKRMLSTSLSSPYINTEKRRILSSCVFDPCSAIPIEDLEKLCRLMSLFTDKA